VNDFDVAHARVNGINLRYLTVGAGPLVIFLHGFPELGISWRHQLQAVADAGYRAVAPDMRGYGGSDAPRDPAVYTHFHLAGDVVGLMDRLGHADAVIVGHDLGAGLAWTMALAIPHRVRGLVALSVPNKTRAGQPPLAGAHPDFYQSRFQHLDVPEQDLERNVRTFLPALYDACGGSSLRTTAPALTIPPGQHFSSLFSPPPEPPSFVAEVMPALVLAFEERGFRGPLNWYRNMDTNWYLTAPWAPGHVTVPATYLVGDLDPAYAMYQANGWIADMERTVPNLADSRVLPGCGHWVGEERPDDVNNTILAFLDDLDRSRTRP